MQQRNSTAIEKLLSATSTKTAGVDHLDMQEAHRRVEQRTTRTAPAAVLGVNVVGTVEDVTSDRRNHTTRRSIDVSLRWTALTKSMALRWLDVSYVKCRSIVVGCGMSVFSCFQVVTMA